MRQRGAPPNAPSARASAREAGAARLPRGLAPSWPEASVVAFCALIIGAMWGGFALLLGHEHDLIERNQFAQNLNLARAFEENVVRTIASADEVLRDLEAEYRQRGRKFDIAKFARQRAEALEVYTSFGIVDETGRSVLQSPPARSPLNFSGTENFAYHARHGSDGLFISAPRRGVLTGKWTLFVTRRLDKPNGSYGGYVSVGIDTDYLSAFYDRIDLGRDALIALIGRDGIIRARRTSAGADAGQDLSRSSLFKSEFLAKERGRVVATSPVDGITRLTSFLSLKKYPLIVSVGTSAEVVFSDYHRRRDVYAAVLAAVTLVVIGFAVTVVSQMRRQARTSGRLRESEQRYLDLVEHASDGIFIADRSQRYVQVNRAACEMLGYTEDELLAMSMSDLVTEDDLRRQPFRMEELRAGKAMLVERRLRRKDGSLIPVEISARMLANGLSQAIVRDITDRKHVEEQLRVKDNAIATSINAIAISDTEGRLTYVNPTYVRMWGYAHEGEILGRLGSELTSEPEHLRAIIAALMSVGSYIGMLKGLRKDGSTFPVEVSASAVRDADGRVTHLMASFIDVTERVRAEELLRALNADLEIRVEARTAELQQSLDELRAAQARLVQAEKMAALGSLVAGIAHEINTPLGIGVTAASHVDLAVRGLHERFARGEPTRQEMEAFLGNASEACEMVLANLQRAADLVRSFKQVAVDKSSGERRRFALKPYLEEVLRSLGPQLRRTRHEVLLDCPEDLEIDSYPGAYSQIVTNLVFNSLTHGFEGIEQGRIEIEVRRADESLQLRYRDNGRGIAPEHLPKIFDPFFTTKRGVGGSGLGLHVLYNLVTQTLGGTIECRSRPGEGVNFEIDVPIRPPLRAAA